jgi:hypothetical protein
MAVKPDARTYVVRALAALGAKAELYELLLNSTPSDCRIEGLPPWVFEYDAEGRLELCSKALGFPVLPFAEALGQDMIACFRTDPAQTPEVVVINPWAEDKAQVVLAKLPSDKAWFMYALNVSRDVQLRTRQYREDDD